MKVHWLVENPEKRKRVILAETKFHAIAQAVHLDGHKWTNALYTTKKTKL